MCCSIKILCERVSVGYASRIEKQKMMMERPVLKTPVKIVNAFVITLMHARVFIHVLACITSADEAFESLSHRANESFFSVVCHTRIETRWIERWFCSLSTEKPCLQMKNVERSRNACTWTVSLTDKTTINKVTFLRNIVLSHPNWTFFVWLRLQSEFHKCTSTKMSSCIFTAVDRTTLSRKQIRKKFVNCVQSALDW